MGDAAQGVPRESVRLTHYSRAFQLLSEYARSMRIFLAGATGAIGRHLVPALIDAGHHVAGLTRRAEKAAALEATGAQAVVCDLYHPDLLQHIVDFAPDAVIHHVTDLPSKQSLIPLKVMSVNKARRRGTDILISAAHQAGANTFMAQSIAFAVPGIVRRAVNHLEVQTLAYPGIVVRYGIFYGPGAWTAERPKAPKTVHLADAAARTVELLGASPGTYELVDQSAVRD